MRILYGVQATGNGPISLARRAMAGALAKSGIEVDYIFSGRSPEQLFDIEPFGDYRCVREMTFSWRDGDINPLRTLFTNNLIQIQREIRDLGPGRNCQSRTSRPGSVWLWRRRP